MASKDCAIFLKRCKIHVKSLKRVNHHVIFGGFYFIFAWRTIINKHEPLDCRSYGVVWKCFIKDNFDINPLKSYANNFFFEL